MEHRHRDTSSGSDHIPRLPWSEDHEVEDFVHVPDHVRRVRPNTPELWVCLGLIAATSLPLMWSSQMKEMADWPGSLPLSWDNELVRIHRAGTSAGVERLPLKKIQSLDASSAALQQAMKTSRILKIEHDEAWIARPLERRGKVVGVNFQFDGGRRIDHQWLSLGRAKRYKKTRASTPHHELPSQRVLQRELFKRIGGIKSCYANSLKSNATLSGHLSFKLTWRSSKGSAVVHKVETLNSDLDSPLLAKCIANKLSKQRVDDPKHVFHGVVIEQRFFFSPS